MWVYKIFGYFFQNIYITEINSFTLFCLFFIFHSEKVKTFSNSAAMDYNRTDELRARGELREFA